MRKIVLGSLAAASLAANGAAAQTLVEHVLPAGLAMTAAQAAMQACVARGEDDIAIVILDRHGTERLRWLADRATPFNASTVARKAYAAVSGRSSRAWGEAAANEPGGQGYAHMVQRNPMITGSAGGLPIKVGEETIGAIAVGGAGGEAVDEACAQAGLDKIKDQLR